MPGLATGPERIVSRRVIGISLLTLVPGLVGGSETYARELIRELRRRSTFDYRVYVPSLLDGEQIEGSTTTVPAYGGGAGTTARVAAMARAAFAPRKLRRQLAAHELAALHFPLTVMLPTVRSVPAVTSILDVQHEYFPQFFSRAERAYRRMIYARSARHSALVVAISDHVKETLVERLNVPPERVRVIHLGVDHERFSPANREREPILLYPANAWPHKNHDRLLAAFSIVRRERPELRLVLTGFGHEDRKGAPGVEVRGRVPGAELAELYRRASALVFPSLYEGFGQPPLEAMAAGCPVAAARSGALPEVCGRAARLFDPTEPDDIASAILEVLDDAPAYAALGLERARDFSWDRCAHEHELLYAELGGLESAA